MLHGAEPVRHAVTTASYFGISEFAGQLPSHWVDVVGRLASLPLLRGALREVHSSEWGRGTRDFAGMRYQWLGVRSVAIAYVSQKWL